MEKQKLLSNLQNDIYCRVGVSKIDGVGWIAIRDIPAGVNPFKSLVNDKLRIIKFTYDELKHVDKNVLKLLQDFYLHKDTYHVLYGGPNCLDVTYYLNHSIAPNLFIHIDSECLQFVTSRDVKKGEELVVNYCQF